jgi:hypothetical protein
MGKRWWQIGWLMPAAVGPWLAYELSWAPHVAASPASGGDVAPAFSTSLEMAPPNLAALRVTLDRPLFEPERRPKAEEAVVAPEPAAAAKLQPVRLTGVIVGRDGGRLALVQAEGQEQPARVLPGEQVAGWRIEEIGDDAVVLTAGTARSVVPLRVFDESPGKGSRKPAPRQRPGVAARRPTAPRPAPADASPARADTDTRTQPLAEAGVKRDK